MNVIVRENPSWPGFAPCPLFEQVVAMPAAWFSAGDWDRPDQTGIMDDFGGFIPTGTC